jgi:ubiquinone/menaquinone biosynthesis C-methylase UbiE
VSEPHSAAYFGDARDFWWNLDQLELCARRIGLADVRTVLDVGAGVGHWGRLLSRVLSADATVVGVDPEPRWVEEAGVRAPDARFSYQQATVEQLPFEDASFDLVTCQTVLIHVRDPAVALAEMVRVVRPGGVVVVSEPNNRGLSLLGTSVTTLDDMFDAAQFHLVCEKGKVALGEGDSSLGDLVPGLFAEAGLERIETYLSDKVAQMLPPYETEEQRALVSEYESALERGAFGWTREEAWRYYEAGGGDAEVFEGAWARRVAENRAQVEAMRDGTFHTAGGQILYLVSGRRPSS